MAEVLTGWGRTSPSSGRLTSVRTEDDLRAALAAAGSRGVTPRGLGGSYNDAAQNGGGTVLRLAPSRELHLDEETGVLTVGAGAVLADLIDHLVPRGWFVPVTPGTRRVTVGGMIAADVHGKNHHADGSIGSHVLEMELLTADGAAHRLAPRGPRPEWFWATVGGMGLTGVICSARLQLMPIPGPRMHVREQRARDLDDLMARLVAADSHRYSVAWVDGTPRGASLGRGLVSAAEHGAAAGPTPQGGTRVRSLRVPFTPPVNPLNRWTVAAFNEAWYRKPLAGDDVMSLSRYFHPLDGLGDWNRLYGPRGFVQYQFVVPDAAAELVGRSLRSLQAIGAASFLSVLKRFGAGNPAPLSFPMPGWTLALDIPAGIAGLARVLDDLDTEVVAAGGRVYLAKDGRAQPDLIRAMYPRLDEWRSVRLAMDPERRMTSDMARRLEL